ncbi:hypothetical protein DA717_13795, partial [Piscirickettsiaceae bacterium NZ-RLO2]
HLLQATHITKTDALKNVLNQLKNILHIKHAKYRRINNLILNIIARLTAHNIVCRKKARA